MHKLLSIPKPNSQVQNNLSQELNISSTLSQLLINRGLTTSKEANDFLLSGLDLIANPFTFSQMQLAVDTIKKAIKESKRILIFGDYDVDGVTSVALLKNILQTAGADVSHYIPHRIKEGYGLSKNIVKIALDKKIDLLITVDCGTNSLEEIRHLREKKIDVIITDHHEPVDFKGEHPATALINPKVKDSQYKYRELAGVGVVFKLCQAFTRKMLLDELDLVTLGTIADSVPLNGENRVIVKQGLSRISSSKKVGIQTLLETSGIKDKKIKPDFISFILAPRINASGRMDTAEIALSLLLATEKEEAFNLAKSLEAFNRQRQKVESTILEEAQDLISNQVDSKQNKIVVVSKEGWHLGVLGIVASKLTDRLSRPVILISESDNLCRGSGRSVKNFHLFNSLLHCNDLLDTFGGHEHAVGMVILKENILNFRKKINEFAHQIASLDDLLPNVELDMELDLYSITNKLISELEMLEPFGVGNPQPVFLAKDLFLKGEPRLLAKDTLKFWVTDGKITFAAIGFGMGTFKDSLISAHSFDLVFTPKKDTWLQQESIILEIKEIFFK